MRKEDELFGSNDGDIAVLGMANQGGSRPFNGEHNKDAANEMVADGDGLEYWDSSDSGSFIDIDEEGDDASRSKSSFPTFDKSSLKSEFEISMTFRSRSEAKHAITLYSVKHQREVKIYKNDSSRIKAKCCSETCPVEVFGDF